MYTYSNPHNKKPKDGFLDDLWDFAKDAAPYVAIAGLIAVTGGTGAAAAGGTASRFAAVNTARGFLAESAAAGGARGYVANSVLRLDANAIGKASWTVYKRILGQNLLRAATDEHYDVMDAAQNSFSTSSWITESILMSASSKAFTQPLRDTAKRTLIGESSGAFKAGLSARYTSYVDDLLNVERAKSNFPTLNMQTGEILAKRTPGMVFADISRKAQISALSPQNNAQRFLGGVLKGATNQGVATQVFRGLTGHEHLTRMAWATKYVQNLDELYLPTTTATSDFQKAYLGLRAFDVSTVTKNAFGSYSRLNRKNLLMGAKSSIGHKNRLLKLAQNTFSYEGAGRLAGSLAMRQLLIATGEDDRMKEAYIHANKTKSESNAGLVTVSGYYRNGHYVRKHDRHYGG